MSMCQKLHNVSAPVSVAGPAPLKRKKARTELIVTAAATAFFAGMTALSYMMYRHHCPNGFRFDFKCVCSGAITTQMALTTGLLTAVTAANGIAFFSTRSATHSGLGACNPKQNNQPPEPERIPTCSKHRRLSSLKLSLPNS